MSKMIQEAFRAFEALNESEEFNLSSSGIDELSSFLDMAGEDPDIEAEIIDLEAEAKEDLKDSYIGKIIVNCDVCHSNIFINAEDVIINEEGIVQIAEDGCPYCMSNDGFTIIGEVKPYSETLEDEEAEAEEEIEELEDEVSEEEAEELNDEEDSLDVLDEAFGSRNIDINKVEKAIKRKLNPSKMSHLKDDNTIELDGQSYKVIVNANDELEIYEIGDDKSAKSLGIKVNEGLKLDKVSSMKKHDRLNGKRGMSRAIESSDEIRGAKYKEFNESVSREISESLDEQVVIGIYGSIDSLKSVYGSLTSFKKECKKRNINISNEEYYTDDDYAMDLTGKGRDIYLLMRDVPGYNSLDFSPEDWVNEYRVDESLSEGFKVTSSVEADGTIFDSDLEGAKEEAEATVRQLISDDKKKRTRKGKVKYFINGVEFDGENYIEAKEETEEKLSNDELRKKVLTDKGFPSYAEMVDTDPENEKLQKLLATFKLTDADLNESCNVEESCCNEECEEVLEEDIKDVSITTEDETMTMTTKEDGGVEIETTPISEKETDNEVEIKPEDEVIAPIEDEIVDGIKNINAEEEESEEETPEEDLTLDDIEEFDEESFDNLGESYLKRCYENVNSFKTTKVDMEGNKLIVEGNIGFASGNTKATKFMFESAHISNGTIKFHGCNENITRGKKAFKLNCSVNDKNIICESLNYNYKSKNELNESVRVYGTVRKEK